MEINKEATHLEEKTWRDFIRNNVLEGENITVKLFDFFLAIIILASITVAIVDTVPSIEAKYGAVLWNLEILFTVLFTAEYFLRATCAKKTFSYIFSVEGIIDLISLSPLYLSLLFKGKEIFNVIRALRLIRIVSRIIKISKKIGNQSFFMRRMVAHLGTNEKIIYYFKSSRKKFLLQYLFIYTLLIVAFSEILFNYLSLFLGFNYVVVKMLGYVLFAIALFLLITYELKIVSVRYAITNQRVLRSEGILNETFKSTNFVYIVDTYLYQSFWHKIIAIGEIKIKTTGNEYENLNLDDISRPMEIKRVIHDSITKNQELMPRGQYKH